MHLSRTVRALALASALPALGAAQSTCRPSASSSEARLLAFFAGPMAFAAAPETVALARGQLVVAAELAFVPSPPAGISRSSGVCGFSKSENSELSPVLPRPRVAIGIGQGLTFEGSYLPPVTVADATPNLFGAAISWSPSHVTLPWSSRLHLRAHGTFGGVNGPVTCSRDALQPANPSSPCYGTSPSNDRYNPNVRGVEAVVTHAAGTMIWYAGGGVNSLTSRLTVDFTDSRGIRDNNVVEISLTRAALMAGAAWAWRPALVLSAQLYSVRGDATTARMGIAWRVR